MDLPKEDNRASGESAISKFSQAQKNSLSPNTTLTCDLQQQSGGHPSQAKLSCPSSLCSRGRTCGSPLPVHEQFKHFPKEYDVP